MACREMDCTSFVGLWLCVRASDSVPLYNSLCRAPGGVSITSGAG